jgi:hypothetical protein
MFNQNVMVTGPYLQQGINNLVKLCADVNVLSGFLSFSLGLLECVQIGVLWLVVFCYFLAIDCVNDSVEDGHQFFLHDSSLHFGEHDFKDEKDDTSGFGLGGDVWVEVVDFL